METIRIFIASSSELLLEWLTPESIIDWLGKQENIYKLTNKDLRDLGIDFIDVDE